MKKLLILTALFGSAAVLSGCSTKEKFYILNWGEYISEDLIETFEDEFNVKVVSTELISNELMYADLGRGVSYDIVFPSDYMVEKLQDENKIVKLNPELIPNLTDIKYTTGLDTLIENCGYDDYFVPYFWGSLGIMYSTKNHADIASVIEANEWNVFFDSTILSKYKVGMYDSSRDSFAAAAMYLQDKGNETITINDYTTEQLVECSLLLKNANYNSWGDDNLKGDIASGNLDMALVYSGDFFDQLYTNDYSNINYDIYIPERNNVFFDAMCIPATSKNQDLAHSFINFMIEQENAIENAFEVGYCPTIQTVYNEVIKDEDMADIIAYPAWHPQKITNGTLYKDLGNTTYSKMEELFAGIRI